MAWKESLWRAGSTKSKPQPTISRSQTSPSVSSIDSDWWGDDGRPLSAISNIVPARQAESIMSESIYSQPNSAPAAPASTYSMPLSDKPLPKVYANIAASAPPISPTFDNGTGKLDPEVVSQIKKTGKIPFNISTTPSMQAIITSAKPIASSQYKDSQAAGHRSTQMSLSNTTPNLRLHSTPLTFPSRKKTATAGPAGTRPPVTPIPLSKQSYTPNLKPAPAPTDVSDVCFHPPGTRSPPPPLPNGQTPHSYPSRMLMTLEAQNLHRSRYTTKRTILPTRTRTPEKQGRHLANAADRPYRPAMRRKRKGTVNSEHGDSASYAASVAAGRSVWNAMRANRDGVAAGYRRTTWGSGMETVSKLKGRVSKWEGHWLGRGSVRSGAKKDEKKKGKKEGKSLFSRKGKEQVDISLRHRLSEKGLVSGDAGSLNNRISRTYLEGERASLAPSVKERKAWWQGNWRYGDGYWERIKKDGKKRKGKKKAEGQEEVSLDEFGMPLEISGWYSDSDQ